MKDRHPIFIPEDEEVSEVENSTLVTLSVVVVAAIASFSLLALSYSL